VTWHESFFTFFTSKTNETEEKSDYEGIDLQEDYDLAVEIKDDLVPLALEYFLNIMDLTAANNEDE